MKGWYFLIVCILSYVCFFNAWAYCQAGDFQIENDIVYEQDNNLPNPPYLIQRAYWGIDTIINNNKFYKLVNSPRGDTELYYRTDSTGSIYVYGELTFDDFEMTERKLFDFSKKTGDSVKVHAVRNLDYYQDSGYVYRQDSVLAYGKKRFCSSIKIRESRLNPQNIHGLCWCKAVGSIIMPEEFKDETVTFNHSSLGGIFSPEFYTAIGYDNYILVHCIDGVDLEGHPCGYNSIDYSKKNTILPAYPVCIVKISSISGTQVASGIPGDLLESREYLLRRIYDATLNYPSGVYVVSVSDVTGRVHHFKYMVNQNK